MQFDIKTHIAGLFRGALADIAPEAADTAVLLERATKVEWVVDMWPRGYLELPDVMPVGQWVKED